jgi:hypothetical protein
LKTCLLDIGYQKFDENIPESLKVTIPNTRRSKYIFLKL